MKTLVILSILLIVAAVSCATIPDRSLITLWNVQDDGMGDQEVLLAWRSLAVPLFASVGLLFAGISGLYALFPNLHRAASSLTHRFRYAIAAAVTFVLAPGLFFVGMCTFCLMFIRFIRD